MTCCLLACLHHHGMCIIIHVERGSVGTHVHIYIYIYIYVQLDMCNIVMFMQIYVICQVHGTCIINSVL